MKRLLMSLALVAAPLVSASLVYAQDDEKKEEKKTVSSDDLFKQLDKNEDGQIAEDELSDTQKRFFEQLVRRADDNKDGKISSEEFRKATSSGSNRGPASGRQAAGGRRGGNFDPRQVAERFDANKDGKITKSELPEFLQDRMASIFEKAGKDELTLDEFAKQMGQFRRPEGGQQPGGRTRGGFGGSISFEQLDTNKDGKVTAEEAPEQYKRLVQFMLRRAEKEADGSLTREEYAQLGRSRGSSSSRGFGGSSSSPLFTKLDSDKDGAISKAELAKAAEFFDELDRNKDGKLDRGELLGSRGPSGSRFGQSGRGFGQPGRRGPDSPRRRPDADGRAGGASLSDRLLSRFDKDKDGKLSVDEVPGQLKENFEKFDANSDGGLDANELRRGLGRRGGAGSTGRPRRSRDGERRRPRSDDN